MADLIGKKILVVDDEEGIRLILRELLRSEGADVTESVDGEAAWQILEREKYDVVLTDIVMPGEGGVGLLRKIRDQRCHNPSGTDLPVVVMTGFSDTDGKELTQLGANAILSKPFNLDQLLAVVSSLC